jgi:anti-sigma factor RsiW
MFLRHPRRWLAPYAEGLLPTAQASAVASHVLRCSSCRRCLDQVRAGQALATRLAPRDAGPTWSELAPLLDGPPSRTVAPYRWVLAAAAAVAIVAGGLAVRGPRPGEAHASAPLSTLALEAHRAGTLELRTEDPQAVERWLGKDLTVPATDDHRRLEGACRLGGGAVAVGYRLGGQEVTLAIGDAPPGPARKQIERRQSGDLQVASWTRGNRSYALVSRLRGDTACAVCHATSGPAAVL